MHLDCRGGAVVVVRGVNERGEEDIRRRAFRRCSVCPCVRDRYSLHVDEEVERSRQAGERAVAACFCVEIAKVVFQGVEATGVEEIVVLDHVFWRCTSSVCAGPQEIGGDRYRLVRLFVKDYHEACIVCSMLTVGVFEGFEEAPDLQLLQLDLHAISSCGSGPLRDFQEVVVDVQSFGCVSSA